MKYNINALSGGFNQEVLHEYKRGTQVVKIELKHEKAKTNLMITGLVVLVGFGLVLTLVNPLAGFSSVAFTVL